MPSPAPTNSLYSSSAQWFLNSSGLLVLNGNSDAMLGTPASCQCCGSIINPQYQLMQACFGGNGALMPTDLLTPPGPGVWFSKNAQQCVIFPNKTSTTKGAPDTFTQETDCSQAICMPCPAWVTDTTGIIMPDCQVVGSAGGYMYQVFNNSGSSGYRYNNEFVCYYGGGQVVSAVGNASYQGSLTSNPAACVRCPTQAKFAVSHTIASASYVVSTPQAGGGYNNAIVFGTLNQPSQVNGGRFALFIGQFFTPTPYFVRDEPQYPMANIPNSFTSLGQQIKVGGQQPYQAVGTGGYMSIYQKNIIAPLSIPTSVTVSGNVVADGSENPNCPCEGCGNNPPSTTAPWNGVASLTAPQPGTCTGPYYSSNGSYSSFDNLSFNSFILGYGGPGIPPGIHFDGWIISFGGFYSHWWKWGSNPIGTYYARDKWAKPQTLTVS